MSGHWTDVDYAQLCPGLLDIGSLLFLVSISVPCPLQQGLSFIAGVGCHVGYGTPIRACEYAFVAESILVARSCPPRYLFSKGRLQQVALRQLKNVVGGCEVHDSVVLAG